MECENGYRMNTKTGECERGIEYGYISLSTSSSYYLYDNYKCVKGTVLTPNGCRKCENLAHCIKS